MEGDMVRGYKVGTPAALSSVGYNNRCTLILFQLENYINAGMEKEQSESMATIPIKPDYAPSEVYSSEPPPAYHRPKSAAVQIAKIIAVTVVFVSIILGGFILASAYVSANASCKQLEQELQLLTETADRLQPLQPEALVQDEPQHKEVVKPTEEPKKVKEIEDNNVQEEPKNNAENELHESNESDDETEEKVTPIHIKLPLQLDLDDLAGSIIDKNQRSKMNCIIEKKRAEEIVDHKPKSIQLPFGLNITTDPRFEHVTGERMVILCESGTLQRNAPPQQSDEQEETIMIQPVVIPYGPPTHFQTHMPQQMRPMPPHPMETLRPPMPGPMMIQAQQQQQQQQQQPSPMQPERVQAPPNPFIQQIAQQLINQRIRMEMQRAQEEARAAAAADSAQRDESQSSDEMRQQSVEVRRMPEIVMAQKLPIPDEVLRQINRLPNHDVIVSVSEESDETPQELRFLQQPRQSAQEMNGRQTYARGIPVHIPVPMIQAQEVNEQQTQQIPVVDADASSDEMRPHYVQPRSVRSVDALVPKSEKRVKRCSCDCAC
ncbi:hypothetical protein FQA39_LY04043 [Lamprigera yunnana]|nr:hypothetical protein FQA39_LY04043 [Lamprigera yunnana]